ncbi:MAG: hypothetical protein JWN15_35, partial [Firmicutes bacterium]|nr:hypothetical protein [Bacillota bacterium]
WSGEVVAVGPGVSRFQKGDRVGVEVHCGCGGCKPCIEGLYNLCEHYGETDLGHAHVGFTTWGGFAEYAVVPAKVLHLLPDGLDWDTGAFTDNIGVALWAVERGGIKPGDKVAVVGPGCFGLLAVQVARAMGAGEVVLVGTRADRLALGRQLGADATVDVSTVADPVAAVKDIFGGKGADLVVEFAGSEAAAVQSLQMARRGGSVVLAGATAPGRTLQVDLSVIVRGHLNVHGSVANPMWVSRRGLELIQKGAIKVAPLITHRLALADFGQAWETTHGRTDGAIRVMMHPEG